MNDSEKVKKTVARLVKRHKTTNPFQIADALGVLYQIGACKNEGCYMFLKNHRYIFLSDRLQGAELNLVMAHELGHALLDRKENCYFIKNKTLLLTSRFERRANLFAACLLISDSFLKEYSWCTQEQLSNITGYPKELIALRLEKWDT